MKHIFTILFIIFAYLPVSAANYSSAGAAFFCGFMQMVLLGVIGLVINFIKRIKKETNKE